MPDTERNTWKQVRTKLGLTQATFALILDVHPVTVSCWERGLTGPNPWCAGLMMQFDTIPNPEAVGTRVSSRLVSDGITRALYELLRETAAAHSVQDQLDK